MPNLADTLLAGGIAVVRTDTLYGIVARANDEVAVERVFEIKARDRDKPLIILLPHADAAYDGAEKVHEFSERADTPTTVIVDSPHAPAWLRHADGSVGYRVPKDPALHALLEKTGPLVAPSANPQGELPARTVSEARKYFGDKIAWYEDDGEVPADQPPSRIIKVHADGTTERLR